MKCNDPRGLWQGTSYEKIGKNLNFLTYDSADLQIVVTGIIEREAGIGNWSRTGGS